MRDGGDDGGLAVVDLHRTNAGGLALGGAAAVGGDQETGPHGAAVGKARRHAAAVPRHLHDVAGRPQVDLRPGALGKGKGAIEAGAADRGVLDDPAERPGGVRSEEHTSELQSLMRISYAVFCLKKKISTKKQM